MTEKYIFQYVNFANNETFYELIDTIPENFTEKGILISKQDDPKVFINTKKSVSITKAQEILNNLVDKKDIYYNYNKIVYNHQYKIDTDFFFNMLFENQNKKKFEIRFLNCEYNETNIYNLAILKAQNLFYNFDIGNIFYTIDGKLNYNNPNLIPNYRKNILYPENQGGFYFNNNYFMKFQNTVLVKNPENENITELDENMKKIKESMLKINENNNNIYKFKVFLCYSGYNVENKSFDINNILLYLLGFLEIDDLISKGNCTKAEFNKMKLFDKMYSIEKAIENIEKAKNKITGFPKKNMNYSALIYNLVLNPFD